MEIYRPTKANTLPRADQLYDIPVFGNVEHVFLENLLNFTWFHFARNPYSAD
jgi:hypothetical protein